MKMPVPTNEELLCYANVPVKLAAAYLGISEQAVRCGIRAGGKDHLPIGVPNGSHCIIPPQKLIDFKEGMNEQERISTELKTISKFLEMGVLCFDDVLTLAVQHIKLPRNTEEAHPCQSK